MALAVVYLYNFGFHLVANLYIDFLRSTLGSLVYSLRVMMPSDL